MQLYGQKFYMEMVVHFNSCENECWASDILDLCKMPQTVESNSSLFGVCLEGFMDTF